MRKMALLTLAGLAALTFAAMPASALCADDGNGGCTAPKHDAAFTVGPCADDAARVCVHGAPDVDVQTLYSGVNNLTLRNELGVPIRFEAFVTARLDDADASDGSAARVRADRILAIDVPAASTVVHELTVDGNASHVRLQALADGKQGELDAEVLHVMTMMGGVPEDNPEDLPVDPAAEDLADDSGPAAGKDAPYLGIVAVVGVLAAIVGLRRFD